MRESMGSVFLYNIIILFIIITFAFLSGTLAYMKAFKANSRIVNAIEKYEGYNSLSSIEIENALGTLGYKKEDSKCDLRDGITPMEQIGNDTYMFCIYRYDYENSNIAGLEHKSFYGVLTYMYFDFPIIGRIRIPLYSKTEKVYRFNG